MEKKETGNEVQTQVIYAKSFKEQLTARGLAIGAAGSVIITTNSMYAALRMGSLPWPIIFVR
ncbi:hypothetical protein [Bacillus sp. T33-2]|uniref:hypothetical protein n=1 Tax=Bacillus sp. T33-2 TaxID=2054168 RepID=UPI001C60D2E1|nr:hypothetical protein [Bacillus sp. T33-2]